MKLTINHLKGYLGTGVIGVSENGSLFELDLYSSMGGKIEKREASTFINSQFKLRLHPLSSLTKYREDLGFVPIEKLGHTIKFNNDFTKFSDNGIDFYDLHWMPHKCIELFQQWHIDYQNLIKENLAIEIN